MTTLTIISTCFNEIENIEECYMVIKNIMQKNKISYEHIFVDNNSKDGTLDILEKICQKDKNVKLIVNYKNYGPFLSNFNALKYASGIYVIINFASDMQDPEDMIVKMYKKIQEGYDVVYAKKINTDEGFFIKRLRRLYYYIIHKSSENYYPMNVNEFMCVKKEIIDRLKDVNDYFPYIRGYIARLTENFFEIEFERKSRLKGKSKNNLFDLYTQGMNGLIFTMDKSIRLVGLFFLLLSLASFIFLLQVVINKIFFDANAPEGITIIISIIIFFFSLTSVVLSLILEYVSTIHNQLRGNVSIQIRKKVNF
jgi:polyisoprenyl-phosphate glycosyltransferase